MTKRNTQAARAVAGRAAGFTLVELVVVIAITAIIAGIMVLLIATPMQAYFAQTRRATLVDSANSARHLIAGDVRSALPNSVRTWPNGNIRMLELLATTYNAAYFSEGGSPNPLLDLTVTTPPPDTDFATADIFGGFGTPVPPNSGYVVVNNLGTPLGDAYALTKVIAPVNTITLSTAPQPGNPPIDRVHLNPGFTFVKDSPGHRVFLVSGPVAYLCDQGAQTLTRYWGYGISATAAAHDSAAKMLAAGAQRALVARNITSCTFGATAGTTQHGQLVMLQMLLSSGGEILPIMDEISEDNPS